jgi:hypothetical protein
LCSGGRWIFGRTLVPGAVTVPFIITSLHRAETLSRTL